MILMWLTIVFLYSLMFMGFIKLFLYTNAMAYDVLD